MICNLVMPGYIIISTVFISVQEFKVGAVLPAFFMLIK